VEHLFEREINSNGVKIHVYESGNNAGESILFLHPQGSTSRIWKSINPFFENEYHVVLMDLRGQGQSEKTATGYDIQTQCMDILSVLDSLGISKVHLVGNSLGGDIATAFSSIYPNRVLSLTNIDSGMIDYIGETGERNLTKQQVILEFKNRNILGFSSESDMYQHVRKNFPPSLWDGYFEEWFKYVSIYPLEDGRITYQIPNNINVQIMEMVCDLHYTDLYRTITCPILFLPAEQEDHLNIKLKNIEVASKYTYTKTSMISHSRHLMVLDRSKELCHEILQFYKEINTIKQVITCD
jgi:2-succinyl-6-hydroxy-2,4-cyclohexadiene-1-carboxylate synthase